MTKIKMSKAKASSSVDPIVAVHNPMLEEQEKFWSLLGSSTSTSTSTSSPDHHGSKGTTQQRHEIISRFFDPDGPLDPGRRSQLWEDQAEVGERLIDRHAWATPDVRALRILREFAPLVEIGCGANAYWSRLLHTSGVDVVAYDIDPQSGGQMTRASNKRKRDDGDGDGNGEDQPVWIPQKGGPEVLELEENAGRNLFLCYPDEVSDARQSCVEADADGKELEDDDDEEGVSLGVLCLQHFRGQYVIHVGELFGHSIEGANAWGRSSGPQFQASLASEFHCLLVASLPSWVHVRDTISVWKRSVVCPMIFCGKEINDNTDENAIQKEKDEKPQTLKRNNHNKDEKTEDDSNIDEEEEDEVVYYKYIPQDERLCCDVSAPCLQFLLKNN